MKIRYFEIEWYDNRDFKYGTPTFRKNKISVSKPSGEIGIDAQIALNIFMSNFGNLKKNTIVRIRELDKNGEQIGEDITPSDSAIIPVGKK